MAAEFGWLPMQRLNEMKGEKRRRQVLYEWFI
jgi:hypothetical protein